MSAVQQSGSVAGLSEWTIRERRQAKSSAYPG